jgi:hypothetical protein
MGDDLIAINPLPDERCCSRGSVGRHFFAEPFQRAVRRARVGGNQRHDVGIERFVLPAGVAQKGLPLAGITCERRVKKTIGSLPADVAGFIV